MPGFFARDCFIIETCKEDLENEKKINELKKIEDILKKNDYFDDKNELEERMNNNFDFDELCPHWFNLNFEIDYDDVDIISKEDKKILREKKNEWKKSMYNILESKIELRRSKRLKK